MNEWDSYRFVLALHRAKTLRGAADQLGVNHSTVSRKLTRLNEAYQQPVFERSPQGYLVTAFGQHLLSAAEEIESITLSTDRVQRAQQQNLSGTVALSISMPIAKYLLSDRLAQFVREYPNIELVLHASERQVDLDRSEADVVVRTTNTPPEHLVGRRLFPYAGCYYAQRDYFFNTPSEQRTWIGAATDRQSPDWLKESPFPDRPVTLRTSGYELRHQALLAGLGMARAACFMADQESSLIRLPSAKPFSVLDFWVLTHPDLRESPRIRAVMKFLSGALTSKKRLIQGKLG